MRKNRLFIFALTTIFAMGMVTGCGLMDTSENSTPDSTTSAPDSIPSSSDSTPEAEVHYGLPVAEVGYYIKDADVIDDEATRYLVYTTNGESAEEDNVIATRSATNEEEGWLYGDENLAIVGEVDGWDEFIGSASIVKGVFEYGDMNYNWLMAYCATSQANDTQYEIGLAVATEVTGTWTKVGNAPIITYNENVYGTASVGCYAPSLVNLNKQSVVRIYYTYADAYGHFAQFVDINAADLDALYTDAAKTDVNLISGTNQLPNHGNLSGGDAGPMFPNADFAHNANGNVYAVKDVSPSAATTPTYAERIELTAIAEAELYTIEVLKGWNSVRVWDFVDTEEGMYERLYSACVVADAYGYVGDTAEIIYNVCQLAVDTEDWMFTQNLASFTIALTTQE